MLFAQFRSFGSMLSPGTFSALSHSTSELLRTLLMMAASEPTSWLFMHLNILLHLAYILGPYLAVWTVFLLTMNFLAHKSDCLLSFLNIRSLIDLSIPRWDHQPFSALPSKKFSVNASPKAISGRTSYLPARLEFHP